MSASQMDLNPSEVSVRADLALLSIIDRLFASQRRWGFQFSTQYRELLDPTERRKPSSRQRPDDDTVSNLLLHMLVGVWAFVGVVFCALALAFLQLIPITGLLGMIVGVFLGFMVAAPFAMGLLRGVDVFWSGTFKEKKMPGDRALLLMWLPIGAIFSWLFQL